MVRSGIPRRWVAVILAVIAGGMLHVGLPPRNEVLVGLLGFCIAVYAWMESREPIEAFVRPWLSFTVATCPWWFWVVRHPSDSVALAGLSVVMLIPMLVAAAMALAWRWSAGAGRNGRICMLLAVLMLLEMLLVRGPVPLPWGLPSQFSSGWQLFDAIASWAGPEVAGMTPILLAALVASLPGSSVKERGLLVTVSVVLVAGILLLPARIPLQDGRTARIALIQPGLGPHAWDRGPGRVHRLIHLTDSIMTVQSDATDFIVWPETALRSTAEIDTVQGHVTAWGRPLVTGAVQVIPDGLANTVVRMMPDAPPNWYSKRTLVPFVERVPFEESFGWLSGAGLDDVRYVAGTEEPILSAGSIHTGIAICFETLFPDHAQHAASLGAQVLLAVTNDGWWSSPDPAGLHLGFSRRRAVETGLPLVQSSVTGFTGLVLPDGSVETAAEYGQAAAAVIAVPLGRAFPSHAPLARMLLLVALVVGAALSFVVRRKPHAPEGVDRAS